MQREQGNVYLEVIGKDVASNTISLEKLDFGYKIGNKINPNQIKVIYNPIRFDSYKYIKNV